MIIDFRVTVPYAEYGERSRHEGSTRRAGEGTSRGYSRVYRENLQGDWRSTVENMLASLDEAGIDRSVIQAEYGGSGDYHALNDAAAKIAHDHADRFPAAFMCLNPLVDEDMVKVLERGAKEQGFRGVNIQAWAVRVSSTDSRFWPVYAKCQELGLIVTVHSSISFNVDRVLDYSHVSHLDKIACDFPELKLVANHGGWPWVLEMIAVAWKHSNVYIELGGVSPKYFGTPGSGWEPLMQYGNSLLQNQVLFATDSMLPHRRCVDELRALPLKNEVRDKWLGDNASRLLGL
ncbi:MAG TPA: amidohydrolase [Dehalococcoidia bacterium]|nr:amidohydrolase [Dehalococcoidia bacterium]